VLIQADFSYNVVIKHPMDLSTAGAKLDSGMYTSRQEFASDIRLIVTNCCTYNRRGDPMYKAGQSFELFFNNRELTVRRG
jgi:transcription initiation factor TFIID subunit 2